MMKLIYIGIVLFPLLGSIAAGLFGQKLGRVMSHRATIAGVAASFFLSCIVFIHTVLMDAQPFNGAVYTWLVSDGFKFEIGFLIDELTAMMMLVVTFVSLMVHIYSIGYMADDDGYQRFFSYISLFTFSMLMLVMANNFMQLFFGWEAVGLVSYLLIGFWHKRESAIYANLKAFLVNRVGDFAFILGIGAILMYFNTLDYAQVFAQAPSMVDEKIEIFAGEQWSMLTVACVLLFIGAMGKSAQVPLHVWLPDSMEGPTPISALIHAATMVTAGIFMVARMSPLYEFSETALSIVLVVGAVTAFFMGLLGLVQNDIKRVVAYSTLSQLGYMTVALGASAYATAIFHLMTHAFFKALLFLAAGSVIIAMHHEQNIQKMGGLKKYMPITYWTFLIGACALIGVPFLSGFYSKDSIIEAVHLSQTPGASFAYVMVTLGVFVTALYTFRMFFIVFHGQERFDVSHGHAPHESPKVVTWPLILLAIPSVLVGMMAIGPFQFGEFFGTSLYVAQERDVLSQLAEHYSGPISFALHGLSTPAFWLAMAGVGVAYFLYIKRPELPNAIRAQFGFAHKVLDRAYGCDDFNDKVFAGGSRKVAGLLSRFADKKAIDGVMVEGTAKSVGWFAGVTRYLQSGFLYHYAFAMIIGLLVILSWYVWK